MRTCRDRVAVRFQGHAGSIERARGKAQVARDERDFCFVSVIGD